MKSLACVVALSAATLVVASPAPRQTEDLVSRDEFANNTMEIGGKFLTKRDISCGPGDGVWAPGDTYSSIIQQFCVSREYTDLSDGYMMVSTDALAVQ
jgi:hypothetical protein